MAPTLFSREMTAKGQWSYSLYAVPGRGTLEVRPIPSGQRRSSCPTVYAEMKALCITPDTKGSHRRIRMMHVQLRKAGLLTMLLKQRKKPERHEIWNPDGYIHQHVFLDQEVLFEAKDESESVSVS